MVFRLPSHDGAVLKPADFLCTPHPRSLKFEVRMGGVNHCTCMILICCACDRGRGHVTRQPSVTFELLQNDEMDVKLSLIATLKGCKWSTLAGKD